MGKFSDRSVSFQDSIKQQYYEARLYRLRGDYNFSEELSQKFVDRVKNKFGTQSPDFLQILLDKSEISLQSADFETSRTCLKEFFEKARQAGLSDSGMVYRGRFLSTETELESGNLIKASFLVENLIFKSENRLLEKIEVADKKGRKRYINIKTEELENRRRDLVRAMLFKARFFMLKGDYRAAETAFTDVQKMIRKVKMKGQDQAFVDFLRYQARFKMDVDEPQKAIQLMKRALNACGKKKLPVIYSKTHPVFLTMCEEMQRMFVELKDFSRAQDWGKIYREIIIDHFGDMEAFKIRQRIPFAASWERKETSFIFLLEKTVRDIESNRLPNQYAYTILEHLYKSCMYGDSVKKAEGYLIKYLSLLELQCGKESVFYMQQQCELANFYAQFSDRVYLADGLFQTNLREGLEKQLSQESRIYLDLVNKEGDYYEIRDQFQRAINNYIKVQQLQERKFGRENWRVAYQSLKVGTAEMMMGEFPNAETKYLAALSIIERQRGKDSREYIENLQKITQLYVVTGRFEEAGKYLSKSLRTVKEASKASLLSFNGLDEELMLLLNKGLYTEAQEKTLALIDYRLKRYALPNHRSYIIPYQIGAEVFLASGNYTTSEAMASKACQVSKAIFGDTSLPYLRSLAIFCRVYAAFGDYERAVEKGQEAVDKIEKYFGNAHVEISKPQTDLAMILFYQGGDPKQVFEMLNKALEINKLKYGANHPRYAESMQFIASFYVSSKQYREASPLLAAADEIWIEKLGKTNTHTAEILALKGEIELGLQNQETARKNFQKAADIYKEVFNEDHPRYVAIMSRMGQVYYLMGKLDKALEVCELTTEKNLNYVKKFFPSMSDREKTKSWAMIRPDFEFFYTLALKYKDKKPSVLGKMFDIVLNTKAILLNASIKVRERILTSGDQALKNKFREWTRKKEEITAAIELGPEERKIAGMDIRKLEFEAEELEVQLSKNSEEFKLANEEKKITWKAIRDMLEEGEYATEMVRFRYFDRGFTDSVLYAALIVNQKTRKNPTLQLLVHGNSMEKKYINYYRNCVKFMIEDTVSFKVFWQPLKLHFPPRSKIYFAPDGVYNELNLESLKGPNNKFVIEEEDLDLISNCKDIYSAKNLVPKSSELRNTAFLLGDPTFYNQPPRDESESIANLPGTRQEVLEINKILKSSRWEAQSFTGQDAREDIIKSIKNPRILHVATHGFFLENLKEEEESTGYSLLNQNKAVENPLLRSGLYLNNAGDILEQSRGTSGSQLGDGVLTAYEAMNLNLSSTDLVVLSACETGRGEVQVGEGVYGLQRAFQIAGAKAVIMSLFKVSDQATQELMNIFYRNWIARGMDKRKAFIEAKKEMLKTKPQPLFWGSFVMVGVG
jgi:CHAT domain-containing protein